MIAPSCEAFVRSVMGVRQHLLGRDAPFLRVGQRGFHRRWVMDRHRSHRHMSDQVWRGRRFVIGRIGMLLRFGVGLHHLNQISHALELVVRRVRIGRIEDMIATGSVRRPDDHRLVGVANDFTLLVEDSLQSGEALP